MSKISALAKLVKKGDSDKLADLLLDQPGAINQIQPKSGYALIHMAIQHQDPEVLQTLISQPGINLQILSKQGESPLEMAVRLNDTGVVTRLLELNVNARRKNAQGETVFHTAIRNQTSRDILKKLSANKFDINQRIDYYGSFLNLAIAANQSQNFFFLIKELNIKYTTATDDQDNTCLLLAVKHNKGDLVVAILQKLEEDQVVTQMEKQFFINAQNKEGNTAIIEAALKDLQTISHKLETKGLKFGIDLTIKNKKGFNLQSIKLNYEKNRVSELQQEKKRQEERVIRKKEKQQEKTRLREQQQRLRIQQKRRKRQQQQKLAVQNKVKTESQKKKTIWILSIVMVVVLSAMYLALVNVIQKKKAAASF